MLLTAGGIFAVASCNLAIGLDKYTACPGDPTCRKDATCRDGVLDGDETDKDCGGSCPPCGVDATCKVAADCVSGACISGRCPADACLDGVKDNGESDTDCGGPCTVKCTDGSSCNVAGDCASGVCMGGSCRPSTCTDGVRNGTETDVDCGGKCGGCGFMKACVVGTDCVGQTCTNGTCAAACNDKVKNGDETDVDCGGKTCSPCKDTQACVANGDCESGICANKTCAPIEVWANGFDNTVTAAAGGSIVPLAALGDSNSLVTTGTLFGAMDFGGGSIDTMGTLQGFFAKFDAAGTYGLSGRIFTPHLYGGGAVAADQTGNTFLILPFMTSLDINGIPSCHLNAPAGASAGYALVKLNATGSATWCRGYGSGKSSLSGVAVDTAGNVIVTGSNGGDTLSFGGPPLTGTGVFAVKLDPAGNYVWQFFAAGSASITASPNAAGHVMLQGLLQNSLTIGSNTLNPVGSAPTLYVARLDATTGTPLWSKRIGGGAIQDVSVRFDQNENVFVGGDFLGTVDFGGGPLQSGTTVPGYTDAFLVKLDSSGTYLWGKVFGGTGYRQATALDVDALGRPVLAGAFGGTADFGGTLMTSSGGVNGADIFVGKFDASGNHIWSRRFGDSHGQLVDALFLDKAGAALLVGRYYGTLNFGKTALKTTTPGSQDMFIAKLNMP